MKSSTERVPTKQSDHYAQQGIITPPQDNEPEVSFFPAGQRSDQLQLLKEFLPHMDKVFRVPEPAMRRNFREYSITFGLGSRKGSGPNNFNLRMRAFLQPMLNGRVEITNWQLTVKTKGNSLNRQEFETADNLESAGLEEAFIALKHKYGTNLPDQVRHVDVNDLYVQSVCVNARIGRNGLYKVVNQETEGSALVMVNSDDVLFVSPHILDSQGKLLSAGYRPEAEIEIKDISLSEEVRKLMQDKGERAVFHSTISSLQGHAKKLFPAVYDYDTSKVDEANRRTQSLLNMWRSKTPNTFMLPKDYVVEDMQKALQALVQAIESPYEDHELRLRGNTEMINSMRAMGASISSHNGYTMALLAA